MFVWCIRHSFAILFVVWLGESDLYLGHPATQTVLPGAVATFTCVFLHNENYYFEINGMPYSDNTDFVSSNCSCNDTACSLSIFAIADNSQNPNGSSLQCFVHEEGTYLQSNMAYLYIAGPPLSPNPVMRVLNATAVALSWNRPFSWISVAPIYRYSIGMFNRSANSMKSWIVDVRPKVTCYCIAVAEESSGYANPCLDCEADERSNRSDYALVATRKIVAQQCDDLVWYVSACNAVGESHPLAVTGGFFAEPTWNFEQAIVANTYVSAEEGTMAALINIQLPYLCYATKAYCNLTIQHTMKNYMETVTFDSCSEELQHFLLLPFVILTEAEADFTVTFSLQYFNRNLQYAKRLALEIKDTGGTKTGTTDYANRPLQAAQCIEQYAALGTLVLASGSLVIALFVIIGFMLHLRGQENKQRIAKCMEQINPIYTENQGHQYESLDKYKHLFLDLREDANKNLH